MKVFNKRAKFDYELLERVEVGIALTGAEVKAVRMGRASLSQSYAKIIGNEVYLINANLVSEGTNSNTRSRKLLLHRAQITSIVSKIQGKKLTLVPTVLYTKGPRIKLELALAKPKRKFEKKQSLKQKDIELDIARELGEKF